MNTVAKIHRAYPRYETMECGHGHCAASVPCTGPCRLKDAVLNLPVIDTAFLDEQLYQKDAKSFGGLDHLPVEMIEPIPSLMRDAYALATIALGGALLAVIVGVLWASMK